MNLRSSFAKIIGSILTIVLLISCQSKKPISQNKILEEDSAQKETAKNIKDAFDPSECVRGPAVPILKKSKYPNSIFKLNEDKLSGTEITELENGDKLIITNEGCEYYVFIFRFETSRFKGDTTDINFWSSKLADLMNGVADGIDFSINLKKGAKALNDYIQHNQAKIHNEITLEPGEIRTYLRIDRIQKIDDKKYGLEISYNIGPL